MGNGAAVASVPPVTVLDAELVPCGRGVAACGRLLCGWSGVVRPELTGGGLERNASGRERSLRGVVRPERRLRSSSERTGRRRRVCSMLSGIAGTETYSSSGDRSRTGGEVGMAEAVVRMGRGTRVIGGRITVAGGEPTVEGGARTEAMLGATGLLGTRRMVSPRARGRVWDTRGSENVTDGVRELEDLEVTEPSG